MLLGETLKHQPEEITARVRAYLLDEDGPELFKRQLYRSENAYAVTVADPFILLAMAIGATTDDINDHVLIPAYMEHDPNFR